MKFRFYGDGDCPDWVLAEIHSSLSILTSKNLKILTQPVVKSILGDEIPEQKLKEMFVTSKNDLKPIKAAISCIRFLLINATRFQTDDATFSTELQQLGLSIEQSMVMSSVFNEQNKVIREHLTKTSFTVNELVDLTCEISTDAIDCACISFNLKNELVDGVPSKTSHSINIGRINLRILLKETKILRNLTEELN